MNSDKKVVGIGYNRFPSGCSDDDPGLSWGKKGGDDPARMKYPYGK